MCKNCEPPKDWIAEEVIAYLNRWPTIGNDLPSEADVLHSMGEEIRRCNRCKCDKCASTIAHIRANYPVEQLTLAEEFVAAPESFRFKALMGNWTGQDIADFMLWNNMRRAA